MFPPVVGDGEGDTRAPPVRVVSVIVVPPLTAAPGPCVVAFPVLPVAPTVPAFPLVVSVVVEVDPVVVFPSTFASGTRSPAWSSFFVHAAIDREKAVSVMRPKVFFTNIFVSWGEVVT
jgi:hypothetical protein